MNPVAHTQVLLFACVVGRGALRLTGAPPQPPRGLSSDQICSLIPERDLGI